MAEQTFKSPGFFEREIDLTKREAEVVGVPAGVIGTAETGPAFVPTTVGSFSDFEKKFGSLDPDMFGPYAVREFLKHRNALTYVRVLGAGANSNSTDISNTRSAGIVKNAGFKVIGSKVTTDSSLGRTVGSVQFISARHYVSATLESSGFPVFSDNDSYGIPSGNDSVFLIRGMLFTSTGSRFEILSNASGSWAAGGMVNNDAASVDGTTGEFKLVLSSTAGAGFANDEGNAGIKIYTASLDPVSKNYIGKILNTDPARFQTEQHLLYAHFPVEDEIATVEKTVSTPTVALVSGSVNESAASGLSSLSFLDGYGRFDTRYSAARTTSFISQPYGSKEYNLFHFESISDGVVSNQKYKISISGIRKSSDPTNDYGTFTVEIRGFEDSDTSPQILEQYSLCNLNPASIDYIARKIGDFKVAYNFDAYTEDERRLSVGGRYPNRSSRIRVVMDIALEEGKVPGSALPFGFRGFPALKTSDTLTDNTTTSLQSVGGSTSRRLTLVSNDIGGASSYAANVSKLSGSILPPVPYRFKVTRGLANKSQNFTGDHSTNEIVDARYYWGTKFDRVPRSGSMSEAILNANASSEVNDLFRNYSKLLGISKLDNLVTGSGADRFNNNKFTLARVALYNPVANNSAGDPDLSTTANTVLTGTAKDHILDTAYIRNGRPDPATYAVSDGTITNRITFASLAAMTSSVYFNRFSGFAKFTNFMYGGFDGVNILDPDMAKLNDRASSSDTGGLAAGLLDIGLDSSNEFGTGKTNNVVASYRTAARILTDVMSSRVNIITIPGIRDTSVTDFVMELVEDYGKAFYVVDVPSYDSDSKRLFSDSSETPDVTKTSELFDGRSVNNNYSAVYFPDVTINDNINNRPVDVPASISVMGALAFNDSVAYPWFAPAGFNRAALDFVTNVKVRLNQADRNLLYESRINPIATFPNAGFVIFGQKTLQLSKSALDRVNVRRMLLEVKRIVSDVANRIVFEQNTPGTRARFVKQITPLLSTIQIQQGIDTFKVVMDSSNNTQEDIENNVLNGRIVVVPTRAIEFIAMDFILTSAGVSFE